MTTLLLRLRFLGANALAAVMDFGVGAMIAVSVSSYFGSEILPWTFFIGGCLALLPDLDLVPNVISGRSASFDHHKTLFHRPLVLIPAASLLAFVLAGPTWALIAAVCVAYHYLHDTGWVSKSTGISWFWPFSERFWSWRGAYEATPNVPHHHAWLKRYWFAPTRKSVSELTVGVGGLLLVSLLMEESRALLFLSAVTILLITAYVWLFDVVSRQ